MDPLPAGGSAFPPTAWTALGEIAAGGAGARAALERIARSYWKPVYVYLRRKGRSEADAGDLVQSFFLHLVERDLLALPDRSRGRFRSWLRAVLEHFLANQARVDAAQKRGGGRRALSLDLEGGEAAAGAGGELSPEEAFDRTWARDVLHRALLRLEREYAAAARPDVLPLLRDRFGLAHASAGPVAPVDDVTMHRARKRLRVLIVDELGDSVREAGDTADEVAELFRALGGKP